MTLWKLAWDNLRFNFMKTIMAVIVLTVAVTSLLLFRGYINYSAEGMREGFVSQTGALQIAHEDYWKTTSEEKPLLKKEDYDIVEKILQNAYGVSSYQKILSIFGLVGNSRRSRFFVGDAYEYYTPQLYQSIKKDQSGLLDNDGFIIGKSLAEFLYSDIGDYVSLLGSGQTGIALITLPISGLFYTGNRNSDDIIGLMTLETAHRFYNMTEGEFDRIRVEISDITQLEEVKQGLNNYLNTTKLEIRDWIQLNPAFKEVNYLNESQSMWATLILILFIITAITQTLQISFFHRLGELGTLRAIGFTPRSIFELLLKETVLMALIGVILGIISAFFIIIITKYFNIQFKPPFSTISYPLVLIVYMKDIIYISGLVFFVTILSFFYPAYTAISKPIVEVIRHI